MLAKRKIESSIVYYVIHNLYEIVLANASNRFYLTK